MNARSFLRFVLTIVIALSSARAAFAQCAGWDPTPPSGDANNTVSAFAPFDDGSGPALYAGGFFSAVHGQAVAHIARWNGTSWSVPTHHGSLGAVTALSVFDDGNGPALIAVGDFFSTESFQGPQVARWDGADWTPLGVGPGFGAPQQVGVEALATFDDGSGPALYAATRGCTCTHENNGLWRWDGARWTPLLVSMNSIPRCMAVFDDGTGPALYVGGDFTNVGSLSARHILKWNGTAAVALASDFDGDALGSEGVSVRALVVHDDGSGPALYAGGSFLAADGVKLNGVARYDGQSWLPLGSGLGFLSQGGVRALASFDDGAGLALVAGGSFSTAGGIVANGLALWRGGAWSALGVGLSFGEAYALQGFDDGSGPALFVGGAMTIGGGNLTHYLARWRACTGAGMSFCFGDATGAACPCANSGQAGHGCENSASTGGAFLAARGAVDPDTLALDASGELPSALSILLQGDIELITGIAFGDGVRCVGGHLLRLYTAHATLGAASFPPSGGASISARAAQLGGPIQAGQARQYLVYYRDPSATFCPEPAGNRWNATNGMRITW